MSQKIITNNRKQLQIHLQKENTITNNTTEKNTKQNTEYRLPVIIELMSDIVLFTEQNVHKAVKEENRVTF